MAVWTRDYRVSTIVLDINGAPAGIPIRGIVSNSNPTNIEVEQEQAASSIFPDTVTLRRIRPAASFTTIDIETALNTFGLMGLCVDATSPDEGVVFYCQKQSCDGVATGSVHDKFAVKSGLVIANNLSVDHMGNASITYDVYERYDGTTAPVVKTSNVALPTVTLGPIGRWTMYDLTVAANTLTGKRSCRLNLNAVVTQEGADSEVFDSVTSLQTIAPVFTATGVDQTWFGTVIPTLSGLSVIHGTTKFRLKRRDKTLAQTNHVSFSFNGLATLTNLFGGQINSPQETSLQIHCAHDGTNPPVVFATGIDLLS